MKKLYKLITIIICIGCISFMTACVPVLSNPRNFWFDRDEQVVRWEEVANAKNYTVEINGNRETTRFNSFSIEDLEAGEYTVKVKANGDGEDFKDSEWVEFTVERDTETGLVYKLINNSTEYQLVGAGKNNSGEMVMESEFRGKPVTEIGDAALKNCKFTSFTVAKTVKTIGKRAFYGATQLKSIKFEEGSVLETINESAFQNCRVLTSIELPDSVKTVAKQAFTYCQELISIKLGNNISEISAYMFSGCTDLTEINGPDSILKIGESAFSGCSSLEKIEGFSKVKSIDRFAFYNCIALLSIPVLDELETIGESAFRGCTVINDITLSDSLTSIDAIAFYDCKNLEQISVGNGLLKVGEKAFFNTKIWENAVDLVYVDEWVVGTKNLELEYYNFKPETQGIADVAFYGCTKLKKIELPNVKAIGEAAFYACPMLWSVSLGDELISIGSDAFSYCTALTELFIGNNLETIGDYAFYGCSQLNSDSKMEINIPDTVKSIGAYAFRDTLVYKKSQTDIVYLGNWVVDCKNEFLGADGSGDIPTVKDGVIGIADYSFSDLFFTVAIGLPDSLQYIGRGAFYGCMFLSRLNMPTSLKSIGDYAFYGCSYVSFGDPAGENTYAAIFPTGLESIGRSAFYQCQSLLKVEIPGTVKTIGDYAFFSCVYIGGYTNVNTNLENPVEEVVEGYLKLGEGIEHIGSRAFYGCGVENSDELLYEWNMKDLGIKSLVIPNSVKTIGIKAFYGCASLKEVTISSSLEVIDDYLFYGCSQLEKVTIPQSVKSIGEYAFRGCSSLTEVDFAEDCKLETIENYAFFACSSLNIGYIPESVKTLGNYVFAKGGLESTVIGTTLYNNGKHTFYGNNNATIYTEYEGVPESWEKYWNSSYRPVVFGCTLSKDRTYVVSFTKNADTILNAEAINGISAPQREGWEFGGWTTVEGSNTPEYQANEIDDIPNGTTVYAIWNKINN